MASFSSFFVNKFMNEFGSNLKANPSGRNNRDYQEGIFLNSIRRNTALYRFFHTPVMITWDEGFETEEGDAYIVFEDGWRISEE